MQADSFKEFPKIELHLHLDCSLSFDVVKQIDSNITLKDYKKLFQASPNCTSLKDYISCADRAIELMQPKENLELIVEDLFKQLKNDNVIYAEIRFAPLLHCDKNLTESEVVKIVSDSSLLCSKKYKIDYGLILCTLRHYTKDQSIRTAKLVNDLAKKIRKKVSIGFRLNPNVDAKTHKNISTGKAENKFGLSIKNFKVFLKTVKTFKYVKLDALSVHIGSQILNDAPFKKTLNVMSKLIKELKLNLKYVDLGGGFGINYTDKVKPINLSKYSKLVHNFSKKLNCRIIFEPGRSIIGNTGLLISKIQFIKKGTNKNFIILDAGMNDFMRPALYEAFHKIIPISKKSSRMKGKIEFVGPICESTCKFGVYKNYPKIDENDFVAITNVGAYGSSLSSNYNTRPLVAEILINKNKLRYIRKRQNLLKLINS